MKHIITINIREHMYLHHDPDVYFIVLGILCIIYDFFHLFVLLYSILKNIRKMFYLNQQVNYFEHQSIIINSYHFTVKYKL